ncbi:DUF4198 domain-containing protein [Peristeroidobacter agariperforans]|uniref:DUF4198 domain-containing protein n=1 Tax=Peristeroidobacter agariperforans TaxID=268404 RepID=UPI00101E19B3|nr:DUF4198 domain-containing protein [Peristeroidobacter agariperforans]
MSGPGIVTATLLAGLVLAPAVHAHDFWIQPQAYWSEVNASIPITLQVGHGMQRQRSQIRSSRIARIVVFAPDGTVRDLRENLHLRGASDDGHLHFETSGTHVVVLETDNRGRSALPAERFNKYVQEEGLTAALDYRQRTSKMAMDAAESYRRVTKSIVQVGKLGTPCGSHITSPLGLPLEIVLEQNPYAEARSDLPVRVFFEGQPLAGALVKLTRLEHDEVPVEARRTDPSGRASFRLTPTGAWLLNVVWTKPVTGPSDVDFDTTFSSLTFGFP